jgi:hypothetical protein
MFTAVPLAGADRASGLPRAGAAPDAPIPAFAPLAAD